MRDKFLKNSVLSCVLIFTLLLAVHCAEALFIRTDESVLGENFINKVLGIAALWLAVRLLGWRWADIGFASENALRSAGIGLAMGTVAFSAAYLAEMFILVRQGQAVRLEFFVSGFSLTGDAVARTGIGYILMCVVFNVINVVMEEGTFRGLFASLVASDHRLKTAMLFQALLFGLWHIVTPLRGLMDGSMGAAAFAVFSAGYVILAGFMGIKWALLFQMTGSLYAGMADHFFNNCIATNLLHVVTDSGVDEMQVLRVMLAQLLSFAAVYAVYFRKSKAGCIHS